MIDVLELTCADPDAALSYYRSASGAKECNDGERIYEVRSAATVYLQADESCGYYRLTNGSGYISSNRAREKGWNVASVSCSDFRLQGLVKQCEHWMRSHLPYNPVRYNLPGPGPMELKANMPEVRS